MPPAVLPSTRARLHVPWPARWPSYPTGIGRHHDQAFLSFRVVAAAYEDRKSLKQSRRALGRHYELKFDSDMEVKSKRLNMSATMTGGKWEVDESSRHPNMTVSLDNVVLH